MTAKSDVLLALEEVLEQRKGADADLSLIHI